MLAFQHPARETEPRWETILEKFVAAGRGLAAVHDAGFIHRDFSPGRTGPGYARKTPNDIDVAVLVDKAKFDEIVRGIQEGTDKANILRQLRAEASKGKIPSFLFERKFPSSSFGAEIYGSAGKMKVQVSLIEKGGSFDIGPYIKF